MNAFQQKLVAYDPKTRSQELLHTEAMKEMSLMSETRRMRLHSVNAGIPPLMWSIVALGSAVNYLLVWSIRMPLRRELWVERARVHRNKTDRARKRIKLACVDTKNL